MIKTTMTPDATMCLKRLLDGNRRFINNSLQPKSVQLEKLAEHQQPFVIILTCSDSRICPEIIFDQNLGDIYTVRTAGHVIDNIILGSIEYAVSRFSVPLIVVLGHSDCSAVKAAINNDMKAALDIVSAQYISSVIWTIRQSLNLTDYNTDCNIAIRSHIINTVSRLQYTRLASIAGMYYNLRTGIVEVLNK